MGFELVTRFIGHSYTWPGTTSNYSATANLHISQITTALAKPFLVCCVFTSRSLATALTVEDLSFTRSGCLHSLPCTSQRTQPTWSLFYNISVNHAETPRFQQSLYCCVRIRCRGNVFTEPLPRNGHCVQSHRFAMGLYTAICIHPYGI
jgi:hypothetical protein